MQSCRPRELWASSAVWMADETGTPDPEILLVCFLGKWRCTGETREILECARGCISRKGKRTEEENSRYRTVHLRQLGDVRVKAKKVKEGKRKLPSGALQTKGTYRKCRFYIHLKERQKMVRRFPGECYQQSSKVVQLREYRWLKKRRDINKMRGKPRCME